jgi:GNAT superfamily N-acetyltransferase
VHAEIRPGRPDDAVHLPAIEVAAGERFREVGLDAVADDEPWSVAEYGALVAAGRIWVADVAGLPVGYVAATDLHGHVHLDQLSVRPDHGGRGLGTALVEVVVGWARDRGATFVTLTTFRDVAWNGPWYERRGFAVDPASADEPGLEDVVAWEAEHDFGAPRVWMRRWVGPAGEIEGSAGAQ